MLKKIFIGGGIFVLLLINLPYLLSFYDNYTGKQFFEQKKYDLAKDRFTQAHDIEGIYNIGNTFYKQGKYEDSIKTYLSILGTGKNELNFRLNYNLGNAYYRFGEKQTNINLKRGYRLKAVDYYKNALKIKYDQQTKDNLEFVLKKLNDLKNQKNNKQQQNKSGQKNNNKQQSQNQKNESKKNGQKKDNQNKQGQGKKQENKNGKNDSSNKNLEKQGQKTDGKKNGGKKSNEKSRGNQMKKNGKDGKENKQNSSASSEQSHQNSSLKQRQQAQIMKALQEYQKNLKLQQKQNMQNYGKVYQPPRSNDPFDDPFFTGMPRQNNVKDW